MTKRYPAWMCVSCGYMMDAASSMEDEELEPIEDDISLCLNCAHVYQLRNGKWITMTPAQRQALPQDVRIEILRLQVAQHMAIKHDLAAGNARS